MIDSTVVAALLVALLVVLLCIIVCMDNRKESFSRTYGQLGPSLLNGKLAEPNELVPLKKVQFFERAERECVHCR